ncbi:hypothetical protein F4801DRAFT_575692 [Xylaria longipes]|nr:hypothetical protein F4801DRAFT_575692 [Xylaria longipes]
MLHSTLLLVPVFGLLAQAIESYSPISVRSTKRQLLTCEQSHGNGSIPCGGPKSNLCFNPGLGQTCCQDSGWCDSGSYCAPIAGYCCPEDQDPTTCAENAATFDMSSSAIEHITTAASTGAIRTFTVTPFLAAGPRPTPVNTPNSDVEGMLKPSVEPLAEFAAKSSRTCHGLPAISTPMVIQISNTSASAPIQSPTFVSPVVQVSIAAESRVLIIYVVAVAVASVIAFL